MRLIHTHLCSHWEFPASDTSRHKCRFVFVTLLPKKEDRTTFVSTCVACWKAPFVDDKPTYNVNVTNDFRMSEKPKLPRNSERRSRNIRNAHTIAKVDYTFQPLTFHRIGRGRCPPLTRRRRSEQVRPGASLSVTS